MEMIQHISLWLSNHCQTQIVPRSVSFHHEWLINTLYYKKSSQFSIVSGQWSPMAARFLWTGKLLPGWTEFPAVIGNHKLHRQRALWWRKYPNLYSEIIKTRNILRPIIDKSNTDEGFLGKWVKTHSECLITIKRYCHIFAKFLWFFLKIHTCFLLVFNILPSA